MKTVLYVLFYRNRPAVIALVLLLAVRFVQAAALARGALVIGETFGDAYAFCSGDVYGAFIVHAAVGCGGHAPRRHDGREPFCRMVGGSQVRIAAVPWCVSRFRARRVGPAESFGWRRYRARRFGPAGCFHADVLFCASGGSVLNLPLWST